MTAALDQPYDELLQALPEQVQPNVDETGHKNNKEAWWTWCLRAELYTLYHIDAHRSADVLMTLLGREFAGVLGCDYFSAYRCDPARMFGVCAILSGPIRSAMSSS